MFDIVLLSGGQDSTTCLALSLAQGHKVLALAFDYSQRHRYELECAERVAEHCGVPIQTLRVDSSIHCGASALTGGESVPEHDSVDGIGDEVPVTYVPARNTIFLALALGVAESQGADRIIYGANRIDWSGYPDCRKPFVDAFNTLIRHATKNRRDGSAIKVVAPLHDLDKAEITALGVQHGAPLHLTSTCYQPDHGSACGKCAACQLRLSGFARAGIVDLIPYKHR